MSNKHLALLVRQLFNRDLQFIEQNVAGVERIRTGIGRGQQIFQVQQFVFFIRQGGFAEALRLLLAEQVSDAVARYAEKPAGDVLDGHQQAVRLDQFVEDVLQNV